MDYQRLKKIAKRTLYTGICAILITFTVYHNDNANLLFRNKINIILKNHLNFDIYSSVNKLAHFADIKGKVLALMHPVADSNIINLVITKKEFNKLVEKKKTWININVLIDDTLQPAKLKFHGTSSDHYYDGKFSFRIKMKKKSKRLNGMKVFNLIKAEEADATIIAANRLAAQFGLISSFGKMVMLNINEKKKGAYYLVEKISDDFLEREFSITKYAKLANVTDWTRKENNFGSNHISDFDLYSGHIEHKDSPLQAIALGKYKKMCSYVEQNDSESLSKFFDVAYMGKYLAILSLFNDIHHVSGDNFKLIYDFKSEKFYPIYRQENGSQRLFNQVIKQDDIYFNNYTNFNKFIFHKSLPNYNYATNTSILKGLLSNDSVRNSRDYYLYKIINEEKKHINGMKDTYLKNSSVLYASSLSRKSQYFNEKQQLEVFSSICKYASSYLNYAHVYGSFNLTDSSLNVITDAFSQVRISSKHNQNNECLVNGINFDWGLNIQYKYTEIPFKGNDKLVEDLIFINNVTKDTIDRVYINKLIVDKREETFYNTK